MRLDDFLDVMERIAPRALAWERDNPGLLIGTERKEIKRVLLALDATPVTVREAIDYDADLLLTHHPLFWQPVRRILPDAPDTAAAYMLIRHGIGMFAAHTNLDAAAGGVNDQLASVLALEDVVPLPPEGLGRMGRLPETTLGALAARAQAALAAPVQYCGAPDKAVSRVAVVGGSGGSELASACAAGADVLVTGELKHDQALDALQMGIGVIVGGHYPTERVVLLPLMNSLQSLTNDVQYKVTHLETACLRGV